MNYKKSVSIPIVLIAISLCAQQNDDYSFSKKGRDCKALDNNHPPLSKKLLLYLKKQGEMGSTLALSFSIGYLSGLIPVLAPPAIMATGMFAYDSPRRSEKQKGQWLSDGDKIMYTYLTGAMLGFSTLVVGTVKGTLYLYKKIKG